MIEHEHARPGIVQHATSFLPIQPIRRPAFENRILDPRLRPSRAIAAGDPVPTELHVKRTL